MTKADLFAIYRDHIARLHNQAWSRLRQFVHPDVHYNGRRIGLSRYREMNSAAWSLTKSCILVGALPVSWKRSSVMRS